MTELAQVVLVDAASGLVVDSARCVDYAAEVAAAMLAKRYGLCRPLALDGTPTPDGFRWFASPQLRPILPACRLQSESGPVFTQHAAARPRPLPAWAIPSAARRLAMRIGNGDLCAGLSTLLTFAAEKYNDPLFRPRKTQDG